MERTALKVSREWKRAISLLLLQKWAPRMNSVSQLKMLWTSVSRQSRRYALRTEVSCWISPPEGDISGGGNSTTATDPEKPKWESHTQVHRAIFLMPRGQKNASRKVCRETTPIFVSVLFQLDSWVVSGFCMFVCVRERVSPPPLWTALFSMQKLGCKVLMAKLSNFLCNPTIFLDMAVWCGGLRW